MDYMPFIFPWREHAADVAGRSHSPQFGGRDDLRG
jgi:hypothetical protein